MDFEKIIEFIFSSALFINALLFIPQAVRIFREKTAKGVSLSTFLGFLLIQFTIVMHGIIKNDYLLVIGYMFSMMTCGTVVFLTCFYGRNRNSLIAYNVNFEELFKQLPGHVYWKNKDGVMLGCNTNNWKDFGLNSLSDYIGKTDYDMFPKEQADKLRQADLEVIQSGQPVVIEEESNTADGKVAWYLSHKIPLRNHYKEIIGILGVSLDITEARKKEVERLEFLENIIALMPGHVYWVNKDNIYLGCNDNQARSAGLTSRKEIIGKRNKDLPWNFNLDALPETLDKINKQVMETGKAIMIEEPAVLSNGKNAVFLSNKAPIRNNDNSIIGMVGISIDVTQQKHNEEELRKTKYMLENVLNTIPGHVYWKDKEGKYLGCNNQQAMSLGYKDKSVLVGKTDFELPGSAENARLIRENDVKVIQNGQILTTEEKVFIDGEQATMLSQKVPLYDNQKNIVGILGVSLDVTELKKTQQELLETQHKLEGMTLVSAVIAHELRTPLSAFSVATEGLKAVFPQLKKAYLWAKEHNAPVNDLTPEYLNGIEQSLSSMSTEVRAAFTFIDMALLNSDPHVDKGNREIFSVSACVEEALSRYPFQGKRDLVHWQHNPQSDFQIKADKILITHVLFNLLKNALYYVAAAGKGDIQIWLERGAEYNKLYFKDTGTGIDNEILPHIFNRFFSRTYHGAGIGLTFCKTVIESLKGNISCESVKGDYTLFTLNFPVTFL